MYRVIFKLPLQEESIVTFIINKDIYKCRIACFLKSCYLTLIHDKFLKDGSIQAQKDHSDFVDLIFKEILKSPARKYYYKVLGIDAYGTWPETSVENLEKVLIQIQKDFDNINKENEKKKPKLDFTKFRFKVGDTILFDKTRHEILGYYFSEEFNNYDCYGYIINNVSGGHNGNGCGYDEYGNHLLFDNDKKDKWYLAEFKAQPIKNNQTNNTLKTNNNGNEIKLQRSKAVIIRGEVPEGCRICSKVHKTAISIQPLGYTAISRGD